MIGILLGAMLSQWTVPTREQARAAVTSEQRQAVESLLLAIHSPSSSRRLFAGMPIAESDYRGFSEGGVIQRNLSLSQLSALLKSCSSEPPESYDPEGRGVQITWHCGGSNPEDDPVSILTISGGRVREVQLRIGSVPVARNREGGR